ncbi:MAG: ATP-binding protein [Chloroflexota bacterium]
MRFVNRVSEIDALERAWRSKDAQFVAVLGRRRVGKTTLLERFSEGKRVVYYRCILANTETQLQLLGTALAQMSGEPVIMAQPPSSWPAVFALIERLATGGRFLLILDETPYWVAKDESVTSRLQNWWDEKGRKLDLMMVICGSAISMMEQMLTGAAPLAGCVGARIRVRPFDLKAAAELLPFSDPVDCLTAYGILGGVPLYLNYFDAGRSIRDNILEAIARPEARLYVEPQAIFATQHAAFNSTQALAVLRAISNRHYRWSEIDEVAGTRKNLARVIEPLIGDMGLVKRVLPVTEESREKPKEPYYVQYKLADNFFQFYFRFIERNQGQIEFGAGEQVVDSIIMPQLADYMGPVCEDMARDWARKANAVGKLPVRVTKLGSWWVAQHELDLVGLDEKGRISLTGEAKWRERARFDRHDLERYLHHVDALGGLRQPDSSHILITSHDFDDEVREWAHRSGAMLVTAGNMLLAP